MSGYTIFINDQPVKAFSAKNDTAALLIAISEGHDTFTLCRIGFDNVVIRTVAVVRNTAC